MNRFVSILALFALVSSTQAQETKTPKIKFEATTIDYGTVLKNGNGLRVFKFTNTGDAPLVITNVRSTCGCTIPKKPKDPIMPGETGEIEVKYDTNRLGPIRKTISVTSNADTPTIALKIMGEVVAHKPLMEKDKSLIEQ